VTTGSSVDVPILYYHRVQAAPPELWYWPKAQQDTFLVDDTFPASLAAQLDWLAAHNYTTILPRDLADHWDTGKPLPAHPVILTFDDGFSNWRTTVLPMLEEHHMIAEFYVVVQNVGRSISWSDVKALAAAGNGIGAHDVHHVQLAGGGVTAASAATMRAEVEGARRDIAANTGVTPDSLAYVGGGYDATLMAIVKAAGYRTARAIDRGVVQSPAIRFRLHVSRIGWADDLSNRQAGTLIPGLPTFAKRISGQDPG
jgi:peptidoglycan/xylan/chitin deacetylase (PgdA/CDA1 family)